MIRGRPKKPIILSKEEEQRLKSIVASRSLPTGLVTRARIILMAAQGLLNQTIAAKVGYTYQSVSKWRQRYLRHRISGLHDELRPGRPRSISDERIAGLIRKTLKTKPEDGTDWTVRSMAAVAKLSYPTVHRIWKGYGLQPHRRRYFKLSTDPFFVEKVRDIVGLYLNPSDNALVLCVDEKSQIQTLARTQPMLSMGLGYVEGVTHDYVRRGTTTLFTALDIATGQVLIRSHPRRRHQEYLAFLKQIEASVPPDLDIHLVTGKHGTHKHPAVKRWLGLHPRCHVHFTPTYAAWLNQVEIWFNIITQKAIRRGTFKSVKELIDKISLFTAKYKANSRPFVWTVTADSILAKIERFCKYISER